MLDVARAQLRRKGLGRGTRHACKRAAHLVDASAALVVNVFPHEVTRTKRITILVSFRPALATFRDRPALIICRAL